MICQGMSAQDIKATGTVVDSNHDPLIGATVRVVGKAEGAVTDIDGRFEVACQAGSQLEISYVGYVSQIVRAGHDMRIVLADDAKMLDETIVVGVGYGTMRKSDLTGAIASVNAKDMKKGVVTSTEQLLQGRIAGLSVVQSSGSPEQGATIRLRGGTSLSASNGPLVVVDGIAGVDFNSVQPNEIVSIDVLKDASAAAIYGSRGANGVIIVTTNRTASDTESKTMQYNGYVAISNVAKQLDVLSASQWRRYVRENNVGSALDFGANTDWQKQLYRTAVSHSHNFSFSNSRKFSGYRVNVTYNNNQGVIKRNNMNRLAGSLTAYQYGLNNRLRLEAGINANFDSWHPINSDIFERMVTVNPTFPVRNPDGSYAQIGGTKTENPVEINDKRTDDWKRHRFLGYGKAELEVIDGLKAVANLSYEYNEWRNGYYVPSDARYDNNNQGRGSRNFGQYTNRQLETYLTYDKTIADIHKLNAMAGYSYLETVADGFGAARSAFKTNIFGYNNLGAGTNAQLTDVSSYKNSQKLISFFGRVNYSLMGRYMLTATLRRDGSSVFGSNNKWGVFPSVSLAWRISDESFLKDVAWLDNLKLRAGFGVTGNQSGIDPYKSLPILSASGAAYYDGASGIWQNAYVQVQNTNPDLKWESTRQWNLGVDFGFFSHLRGSVELYHKKTSDLLWTYPVPQPPYIVGTMLANVGDLVNKGFELTLGYNAVRTRDFTLDVNASLSYNHQKITSLSGGQYELSEKGVGAGSLHGIAGLSNTMTQYVREGYGVGSFFGAHCLGIDEEGQFVLDRDEDGNIKEHYLGNAMPKWNLGLGITATYKDFDLNIAGYGMFGQRVLNATRLALFDGSRLPSQNTLDDFLGSGLNSSSKMEYSDYFIENGSFLRLQSVTLGYTIPGTKKFGFDRIRLYVTGENLFCITGYKGIDPELPMPDNVLRGPGIDRLNPDTQTIQGATIDPSFSPRPRTFSFGLNLSF